VSPGTKAAAERSKGGRLAFLIAGHVCLGLAVAGIVLPLLPATVFLLAAAACYARGSQKFYDWLLQHKWFGPPIKDWQRSKAMTVKSKVVAIVSVWVGVAVSVFLVKVPWVRIALGVVVVGVTVTVLLIKTKKSG
jgi:uncharacterized membrane protein YbaN (DUF454 family)